jgi:glycosyltransferase involved in cell wall biosynthesis
LATAVVANSRATAARFDKDAHARKKLRVIYNGVEAGQFAPGLSQPAGRRIFGIPEGRPLVVFAGRLEHGKGPDLFIEAAALVHRTLPQAYFLLAGVGPMRDALLARVEEKGLPAVFVGKQADLKGVLGVADVLVVPSRQEAFGRVLIEAMAAEVPIVATQVGGIPEVCQDGQTGLLVPPEDPGALAAAVLETLHNAVATNCRVRAAAETVRSRFSLKEHTAHVCELYESLLPTDVRMTEGLSSQDGETQRKGNGLERRIEKVP